MQALKGDPKKQLKWYIIKAWKEQSFSVWWLVTRVKHKSFITQELGEESSAASFSTAIVQWVSNQEEPPCPGPGARIPACQLSLCLSRSKHRLKIKLNFFCSFMNLKYEGTKKQTNQLNKILSVMFLRWSATPCLPFFFSLIMQSCQTFTQSFLCLLEYKHVWYFSICLLFIHLIQIFSAATNQWSYSAEDNLLKWTNCSHIVNLRETVFFHLFIVWLPQQYTACLF